MGNIAEYAELDGVTVSTTELSILSGTTSLQARTDQGIYGLWLDPIGAALAKGDEFRWRVYETVKISGGTKRVVLQGTISHANSENIVIPALMLRNGWDMTLIKVAGTDRAWDASVRGVTQGITQAYELSAVTVGASELSIVSGTTTLQTVTDDGVYQLFVDPVTNMAKGDEFMIRIYEKVEGTGGVKRVVLEKLLPDAQAELLVSPMLTLMHGWDMTIAKVAGTDRAFDASIRRV